MRALPATLLFAIFCAGTAAAGPLRAPVITPGCQGEGCYDKGHWIVTRPLRLYARPFAPKPIATIAKGAHLTALGGEVWTTKIGTAVLTQDIVNQDPNGTIIARLKKGTRIRLLVDEGEGYIGAATLDGKRIEVIDGEFRKLTDFRATDWVRVRTAEGRGGWIRHDYEALDCSSYYDDSDLCLKLNPR